MKNRIIKIDLRSYFFAIAILIYSFNAQSAYGQAKFIINTDSVINVMAAGFGMNTFAILDSVAVTSDANGGYRSWGGSSWGATPAASDDKAWAKIFSYMDWLAMDYTRLNIEHRMIQPERGKYSFDNPEMLVLYRYLDYFEKNGVIVELQEMYPNAKWLAHKELQSNAKDIVRSGPADLEAWSDGLIALLKHLLIVKKYTCIKYFGIVNEPQHTWSWWKNPDGVTSQPIMPALQMLHSKLKKENLKMPLSGPQEMFYFWEVLKTQPQYSSVVLAYSYHEYMTIIDWWDSMKADSWLPTLKMFTEPVAKAVKVAHDEKKPFFFSEHGSMNFGLVRKDKGPSLYSSILKDVEFGVRYSNIGVDGFSRWSLLNRNDLDGRWGFVETYDNNTYQMLDPENYKPIANTYFGYGLLTRFIYSKSAVVKSTISNYMPDDSIPALFTATYLSPSRKEATIVVVNDKPVSEVFTMEIKGKHNFKKWYKYQLNYTQKNKNDLEINPLKEFTGNKFTDKSPGLSITVYSTKKLMHVDKGLVNE